MRLRSRVSGSPAKLPARTMADLNALASRLTAALARSLSLHTWAAVKATNRPKMMPSYGSKPGEIALKDFTRSPTASLATAA
jgi:hypothetical protein